jgi:hypothetical protein
MKMTKKFVLVAAAAAMIFGMVGCAIGEVKIRSVSSGDGTQSFKVSQSNPEDHTIRGIYRANAIPRAQATCVAKAFNQVNTSCDGMIGLLSVLKEDRAAGTMNFVVVGVRNNKGKTQTYASYYCNIKKDELSTTNFVVATKNVFKGKYPTKTITEPFEVEIEGLPDDGVSNLNVPVKGGILEVGIEFDTTKEGEIIINWYKEWETMDAAASFKGTAIKTVTATNAMLGTTQEEGLKNGAVYVYANIYKGKKLDATWDIYNLSVKQSGSYADEDDTLPLKAGEIFFEEY